jgi:hypothetical protein
MLSMINPDTLSQYNPNPRYSTIGGNANQMSQKASQEHFYPNEEVEDTMPNDSIGNKQGGKT